MLLPAGYAVATPLLLAMPRAALMLRHALRRRDAAMFADVIADASMRRAATMRERFCRAPCRVDFAMRNAAITRVIHGAADAAVCAVYPHYAAATRRPFYAS